MLSLSFNTLWQPAIRPSPNPPTVKGREIEKHCIAFNWRLHILWFPSSPLTQLKLPKAKLVISSVNTDIHPTTHQPDIKYFLWRPQILWVKTSNTSTNQQTPERSFINTRLKTNLKRQWWDHFKTPLILLQDYIKTTSKLFSQYSKTKTMLRPFQDCLRASLFKTTVTTSGLQ